MLTVAKCCSKTSVNGHTVQINTSEVWQTSQQQIFLLRTDI